jgi:hypothetical protein
VRLYAFFSGPFRQPLATSTVATKDVKQHAGNDLEGKYDGWATFEDEEL